MQDTDKEAVAEVTGPIRGQELKDVEELTNELKRLLARHESTLNEEGVRRDVETLERWMESYRNGLSAADRISHKGVSWLYNLRDHLKYAAEEIHRLESEGGNPANKEQAEKIEELLKAARRIEKVIPSVEQMFKHSQHEHEAA